MTTLKIFHTHSLRLRTRLIEDNLGDECVGLDSERVALSHRVFDVLTDTFACTTFCDERNGEKTSSAVTIRRSSIRIAQQGVEKTSGRSQGIRNTTEQARWPKKTRLDSAGATCELAYELWVANQDARVCWVHRLPFVDLVKILSHIAC